MNKLLIRLLKLGVIVLLAFTFWEQYNHPSLLPCWIVFSISLYLAISVIRIRDKLAITVYGIVAILFNPFYILPLGRYAWNIIEILVVIIYAISLDWKGYEETLSQKGKAIYHLGWKCVYGTLIIIAAFLFVIHLMGGNPYHQYLLLTEGTTVQGYLTNINENISERDDGGEDYSYDYWYYFYLQNKKEIDGYQSAIAISRQEIPDLTKPIKVAVVYLKSNPQINRLKFTLPKTRSEFFLRKVLGGIFMLIIFGAIGFLLIKDGMKKYLREIKDL